MTGVEILSSETVYNTILPGWCFVIGILAMFAFFGIMAWQFANERVALGFMCLVLALGSVLVGTMGVTESKTDINHVEYKVTIDDSVSMNEFLDKYEILDQEGKIYTVKERE